MDIVVNYQSSIMVNKSIFFDPLNVSGQFKAKYIFLTHPHWDHLSVLDIKKILLPETKIICPLSMKNQVEKDFSCEIFPVLPNEKYSLDNLKFRTFPAYNINKKFHPRQENWVGYQLEIDGTVLTVTGDTDATPELLSLKTDILMLPIGGTYTIDFLQASKAVNAIKPKKVIPTHYGQIVGDKSYGEKFAKLIDKDIVCEIQI